MMSNEDYMNSYNRWLKNCNLGDETINQLKSMQSDEISIKESFYKNLEFGTGGLRGIIGVGTNRINIYTIRKATQGLANYMAKTSENNTSVAIAYDSRNFSKEFALESALVLAAKNIKVYLFEDLRPTPELSYAVRHLNCSAGIVITASHNPSEYNGYKVYGKDGGQITLAVAEGIINEIDKLDIFEDIKALDEKEAIEKDLLKYIGKQIDESYLEKVSKVTINNSLNEEDKKIKIVYTPIHGSGLMPVTKILNKNGYKNIYLVEEQTKPDGNFPTVKSPNPEEAEALKMAIDLAKGKKADLVIGTDPDADRVGVAVRNGEEYNLLTGNQIGSLLTYYIINTRENPKNNDAIIKTIVTSELGAKIAKSKGVKVFNTLTGFKFIGEKIKEFEQNNNYNFLFGYEESYGYLAGTFVRDKDAVIASALIAEMTAFYNKQGISLLELLDQLYKEYGYYKEVLESYTFEGIKGKTQIANIIKIFKSQTTLTETFEEISSIEDYEQGKIYFTQSEREEQIELPKSDVIKIIFKDSSWLAIRPSGTEPKLKIYYSVIGKTLKTSEEKSLKLKMQIEGLLTAKSKG